MTGRWGLLLADFEREYSIPPDDVDGMPWPDFMRRVSGLSSEARWPAAYRDTPVDADSPAAIAAVTGRYLG